MDSIIMTRNVESDVKNNHFPFLMAPNGTIICSIQLLNTQTPKDHQMQNPSFITELFLFVPIPLPEISACFCYSFLILCLIPFLCY